MFGSFAGIVVEANSIPVRNERRKQMCPSIRIKLFLL
jgi:hypothetical protein